MKAAMKARLEAIQTKGKHLALVGGTALATTGPAHAAIDLTAVEGSFADLMTALGLVGGLILAAAGLAVTFKWVKGMIFS